MSTSGTWINNKQTLYRRYSYSNKHQETLHKKQKRHLFIAIPLQNSAGKFVCVCVSLFYFLFSHLLVLLAICLRLVHLSFYFLSVSKLYVSPVPQTGRLTQESSGHFTSWWRQGSQWRCRQLMSQKCQHLTISNCTSATNCIKIGRKSTNKSKNAFPEVLMQNGNNQH